MKKYGFLASAASIVICLSMLVGCVSNSAVSKENLFLSIHMNFWSAITFNDDWPVYKKAAEKTGISLKSDLPPTPGEAEQAFNIMIETGKLSDIVVCTLSDLNKYGRQGYFIPLNDLIEQYAPNIKAFLDENPDIKEHMTASDGNIYSIAHIPDGKYSEMWFIREDWVNELGLKIPETFDEYYNVLCAIKNGDPNKNGINDEVPLFCRSTHFIDSFISLFGPYGIFEIVNGKVRFNPYLESYKDGLKNFIKWHSEGVVDNYFYSRGMKARDELLRSNCGGATHDWYTSTTSYNEILQEKYPGFKMAAMPPPMTDGVPKKEFRKRTPYGSTGWAISSKNKYPVETIKYFDFWFTEEGRRLANYGIEGEQYEMLEGKPVFKKEFVNNGGVVLDALNNIGAQLNIGVWQDYGYEEQLLNNEAKEGIRLYEENGWFDNEPVKVLSYNTDETETIEGTGRYIEEYMNEAIVRWVKKTSDINDEYDGVIRNIEAMGLEKVIKAMQTAYDRANGGG